MRRFRPCMQLTDYSRIARCLLVSIRLSSEPVGGA